MVQIWHPTSAETHMWGKQPAAMLAIYTGRGVTPEVNLREGISRPPPQSSNKAEPTLETSPEVPNRGISGPKNGHVSNKKFEKKEYIINVPMKRF